MSVGCVTGCPPGTNDDGPGCSGASDGCRPRGVLLGVDVNPERLDASMPRRMDEDRWELLMAVQLYPRFPFLSLNLVRAKVVVATLVVGLLILSVDCLLSSIYLLIQMLLALPVCRIARFFA